MWGASIVAAELIGRFDVSSRAPVWGASDEDLTLVEVAGVSSRAPVWGASERRTARPQPHPFQVVPPCGGHQISRVLESLPEKVSSRAPVWGASRLLRSRRLSTRSFKSCPRVGGISVYRGPAGHRQVSSRAPVWGASDLHLHLLILVGSFKSCPRVGGILVAVDDVKVVHSFKSCPRVGGIQGKPVICMTMIVSSRAPVWGASYFNRNYVAPRTVSSRAPVWGASLADRWR